MEKVELAREAPFALGNLTVSPVTRELVRPDGEREVLEHRVMQVLVALARNPGAIVTRDDLVESCWDGRIVGDDAINRVISRLRKSAEGVGQGGFRIETLTKVGYRLVLPGMEASLASVPVEASPGGPRLSRRALALGGAAAGLAALGGGTLLYRHLAQPQLSPEAQALKDQGFVALAQDTREGLNQGIGLLTRLTEIAPESADAWGMLGFAYARSANFRPAAESKTMNERAQAAGRIARGLDPGNAYSILSEVYGIPLRGNWSKVEAVQRRALAARSDDNLILMLLGHLLSDVGRMTDAAGVVDRFTANPLTPAQYYQRIQIQWGAGQLERLESTMAEAGRVYPTQFAIWFSRFYVAVFSGRPGQAVAMGEDIENRPSGFPAEEFADILAVARAARSRAPAEIAKVMDRQMNRARNGSGMAENALQFACLFGRLDEAFAIAQAYYFSRGFVVPELRFSSGQGSYLRLENRTTRFLFQPSTAPMRADPRFRGLIEELGLEAYWRDAGIGPDFRRR